MGKAGGGGKGGNRNTGIAILPLFSHPRKQLVILGNQVVILWKQVIILGK